MGNNPKTTVEEMANSLKNSGFLKEANLFLKIHREIPFGRLIIITRNGRIERVEREVEYDDLSDGL